MQNDEFGRAPSNDEVMYAKRNGVPCLIERTYKKRSANDKTIAEEMQLAVVSPVRERRESRGKTSKERKFSRKRDVRKSNPTSEAYGKSSSDEEEDGGQLPSIDVDSSDNHGTSSSDDEDKSESE